MIFKPPKFSISFNIIEILTLFLVLLQYLIPSYCESFHCCFSEPLCVITEYAPYGDLLGFLRKKRGLRDDYYDIQQLPERSLTSQLLMKFAWEIADGMAHLSAAKVRFLLAGVRAHHRTWRYFKSKRNPEPNVCCKEEQTWSK